MSVIDPDKYMVLGCSYKVPLMAGRLEEQTIRELISSPSFDRESFEREYISRWSGARKGAIFTFSTLQSLRKVVRAENRAADGLKPNEFYVISADLSKDGSAKTSVIVIKVSPGDYMFNYKIVNLLNIDSTDYEVVANELKEMVVSYNARLLIYDANGIGASMRDWLNKPTRTKEGKRLGGLGIINPPSGSAKDVIKYNHDRTVCYEIKTGGAMAGQIHKTFFSRISNGSIRLLIKTNEALTKLERKESFLRATNAVKKRRLQPYRYADEFELQLRNLIIQDVSDNITQSIKVERKDKKIEKDFFSAAEYGVYVIMDQIEKDYYKKKNKKKSKFSEYFFFD